MSSKNIGPADLHGKTVIVVDDEVDVANTISDQLESIGMKVVGVANDAASALELVREKDPSIVILDIRMPDMDGIELAGKINGEEPRPILFLSAYSDDEYIRRASESGVMTYLVKPVSIDTMVPSLVMTMKRFGEMTALRATVDEMKESLDSDDLVQRAVRVIMDRERADEEEAYSRLRSMSQEENRPMASIAAEIVETGGAES